MMVLTDKLREEKKDAKQEIRIDGNHTYMIGKFGPVIKCVDADTKVVSFLPVKKDIDLEKMRLNGYGIDELVEREQMKPSNILLGKYNDEDLYIKKGKYGIYLVWGENNKSLSSQFGNRPIENVTYIEVLNLLEKDGHLLKNVGGRYISASTSIRKGKFGEYIYHKTEKMKKPEFFKLKGFPDDHKTCDIQVLKSWIKETYKVE